MSLFTITSVFHPGGCARMKNENRSCGPSEDPVVPQIWPTGWVGCSYNVRTLFSPCLTTFSHSSFPQCRKSDRPAEMPFNRNHPYIPSSRFQTHLPSVAVVVAWLPAPIYIYTAQKSFRRFRRLICLWRNSRLAYT